MHLYLAIAIATALVVAPEGDAAVSEPPVSSLTCTISSSGMSHGRPSETEVGTPVGPSRKRLRAHAAKAIDADSHHHVRKITAFLDGGELAVGVS